MVLPRDSLSPFLSSQFLACHSLAFGVGEESRCITLWRDGEQVSFLPITRHRAFGRWPVWYVSGTQPVAGLADGLSDKVEPPNCRADPTVLAGLVRGAVDQLGPRDTLLLRYVPLCHLQELAGKLPIFSDRAVLTRIASGSPFLELPDGWDGVLAQWSASKKKRFNYRERRLSRSGRVVIHSFMGLAPTENALNDVVRVDANSWKASRHSQHLPQGPLRRFMLDLLRTLCPLGRAGLFLLYLDDRPIAYEIVLSDEQSLYSYVGAYDDAYRVLSPGMILIANVIREAATRGRRRFDFLRGNEPYKYEFAAATAFEADVMITPSTNLARLANNVRTIHFPAWRRTAAKQWRILTGQSQPPSPSWDTAWRPWPGIIASHPSTIQR